MRALTYLRNFFIIQLFHISIIKNHHHKNKDIFIRLNVVKFINRNKIFEYKFKFQSISSLQKTLVLYFVKILNRIIFKKYSDKVINVTLEILVI